MKKRAFTMIELIFVIVVVGILAAIMIPKLNRNASREAANQILTHIRYTQHLAMQDDKYENFVSDNPVRWFRMRWGVTFNNTSLQKCSIDKPGVNTWKYSVFFDKRGKKIFSGNINSEDQVANDIYKSGKFLSGGWSGMSTDTCKKINKELNLGKRFGVTSVDFKDGCSGMQTINFDEMGRPMKVVSVTKNRGAKRPYDRLLKKDCSITITDKRGNQTIITIEKESGFASIKENS